MEFIKRIAKNGQCAEIAVYRFQMSKLDIKGFRLAVNQKKNYIAL